MFAIPFVRATAATAAVGPVRAPLRRLYNTGNTQQQLVVAVRRETKNRWERRTPLTPNHVRQLVRKGMRVLVQPSPMRIFPASRYLAAGAEVVDNISEANLILGVKEVPIAEMLPDHTHVCFSHTVKAQEYNMAMLDAFLQKNVRLVDYERMLDASGKRVIGFGRFAGLAGMIDLLRGLGDRMLGLGASNPFLGMGYADYYHSLAAAKNAVFLVGKQIEVDSIPKSFAPAIFAFTGSGNVTQGALEIFKELPHEMVESHDLPELVRRGDNSIVYGVKLTRDDLVRHPTRAGPIDKHHYNEHPHEYEPIFHEKIAPYITALVHCMYWDARFPRLLTKGQMADLYNDGGRLVAIADISADPNGSIEFTKECTKIDRPYLVYNPNTDSEVFDWEAPGILLGSVDNLPAELPREASELFGDMLLPYIEELAASSATQPFDQQTSLSDTVRNAIICSNGSLTPNYKYIADLRAKALDQKRARNKRVLLLGSGMVAGPLVHHLCTESDLNIELTIGSNLFSEADKLAAKYATATAVEADVANSKALDALVAQHDLVISLVPPPLHPAVAEACLRQRANLVTSSYVSPAMQAMDEAVREAGLVFLNEVGLDPGIDHLAAMKIIEEVQAEGGQIEEFVSWCGGLPVPEHSANPLGYKFSWSPAGMINAGLQEARYREDGADKTLVAGTVFASSRPISIFPGLSLEGYPNRNSIEYIDYYGLEGIKTMIRGTLRYSGFSKLMQACQAVGLLQHAAVEGAASWADLLQQAVSEVSTASQLPLAEALELLLMTKHSFTLKEASTAVEKMRALGLLSTTPLPEGCDTVFAAFSRLLEESLQYGQDERDFVLLVHLFGVRKADGSKVTRMATLACSGDAHGESAMARTVGKTAALAADAVLRGEVKGRGVLRPLTKDIWAPLLSRLEQAGIKMTEEVRSGWIGEGL